MSSARWQIAAGGRFDRAGVRLADRHYSRRKPGSPQFVKPGRCLVLITPDEDALWVTSWPFAEYVRHAWAGAWECALFRNENPARYLSSELIAEAVAVTRYLWGEPPALGMVTMVDPLKTRRKRDPGRCYRKAGWSVVGRTKQSAQVVLQQIPHDMPEPLAPFGTLGLFTQGAA